jgi:hypothetical protein
MFPHTGGNQMTNPTEKEPEQSNIMQLFQVINNPRHDDDHVNVVDLAHARLESTEHDDDLDK